MGKTSAGILLFRRKKELEVFLVHPGGPFWVRKDAGVWSIPKGEFGPDEDPMVVARREFREETGIELPKGEWTTLAPRKQKGGKTVYAWALQGDVDCSVIKSNVFELEWPPKSGKRARFPEVDRAAWFSVAAAREKINPAQAGFIEELLVLLASR